MSERAEPEVRQGPKAWRSAHQRVWQAYKWFQQDYEYGHQFMKRMINLDRGNHWSLESMSRFGDTAPTSDNPRTQITVQITKAQRELLMSFLFNRPAEYLVSPLSPESVTSAILNQRLLNYHSERQGWEEQWEVAGHDYITTGRGIIRTGFERIPNTTARPDKDGYIELREFILEQRPFEYAVDPFMLIYDTCAPDHTLRTARWCAEFFIQPRDFIESNSRYEGKAQKDIRAGREKPQLHDDMIGQSRHPITDKRNLCTLYEYWDKLYRWHYIFVKGVERPLVSEPWPYFNLLEFPYVFMDLLTDINEYWPKGLPSLTEDIQLEMNRTRSGMVDYRRRFVHSPYEVDSDVANEQFEALKRGEHYKVPAGKPGPSVRVPQMPQLNPEEYRIESVQKSDSEILTGLNELIFAQAQASRTSAREIMARTNFSMLRIERYQAGLDRARIKAARQIINLMKTFYVGQDVIDLVGPQGEYWGRVTGQQPDQSGIYWAPYTASDIQGEFDVKVETSAAPKKDPTLEVQERMSYLQLGMQISQFINQMQGNPVQLTGIDLLEGYKWVGEAFHFKDLQRIVPSAAIAKAPIYQVTEAQMGQQQQQQQQPGIEAPATQETAPFQQSANPISADLGALLGALGGNAFQGGVQ